jgi:probable F420-dependent oxidoreductase
MRRRIKIGCHLPVYGPVARREPLIAFARRVEALGYDSLWVSDHVVIPWRITSRYPYNATGDFPLPATGDFLEPLTALALVAGVTDRIALGTSVLVLPHRHPVLAAKMLATLDHLAPGRVICGAGVGWMREEIELLGAPYARRGAWSDEAIAVMRACWSEERAAFAGQFFRFDPVGCRPHPARGTIPIWIGGHSERAFRRVAELGDGWHAAFPTHAELRRALPRLRGACAKAGRDFTSLTLSARMGLPTKQAAVDTLAAVRELRDAGVHHLILEPAVRDADTMTGVVERFAELRATL